MSTNIIDSASNSTPESAAGSAKRERKAKKAKPAKAVRAKELAAKPKGDRTNKRPG